MTAQPHISVRVRPSSGAPGGWKSVARVNDENGMVTKRHPSMSSLKLKSKRSAAADEPLVLLSKISAW
jgi:hypothetical protein